MDMLCVCVCVGGGGEGGDFSFTMYVLCFTILQICVQLNRILFFFQFASLSLNSTRADKNT